MPQSSRRRRFRPGVFLLLLQLAAITAVVAIPWLLSKQMLEQTLVAQDWVVHAAENKSSVSAVQAAVGEVERNRLLLLIGNDRVQVETRIEHAYAEAMARLGQLAVSTADNSEQQGRVAQVQALIEVHQDNTDRILRHLDEGEVNLVREIVENAANRERMAGIAVDLIAEEDRILDRRRAAALQQRRQIEWAGNGIAIGQLILLALIVALSERQQRRRTRAEEQSRRARERADKILRTVRDPIVVLDSSLRVQLCNPAFETLYSGNGDDLIGVELGTIGAGAWQDATLQQRLRDVLYMDRELWDFEIQQDTVSGGTRHFVLNAWSVPGERGREDSAVIVTANDVTARHSAERQIRELNDQLSTRVEEISQANRDLEAFSYSVSHDLRAPLRHISAFAGKLERELDLEPGTKAQSHLRVIGDSAQRMGRLIDELLLHSRLGRGLIRHEPVSMASLIEQVRSELASEVAGRNIEWRIGDTPVVAGDASMLRLVWQNLIGNAVKYTAGRDPARIEIEGRRDEESRELVFSIRDNGAGFDMTYVDKLFGVFQRLHTEAEFPGTGIGLANVRRIVLRHGGRVWAEGKPEQGATFHFSLPERPVGKNPEREDVT